MASRTGQEIPLKQYPKEMPTEDIFEIAKVDMPHPKDGEFLVLNVWLSVDPYMRGRMRSTQEAKSYTSSFQLNKPLDGGCVVQIIESKNEGFTVGEYVLRNFGWNLTIYRIDLSTVFPVITYSFMDPLPAINVADSNDY